MLIYIGKRIITMGITIGIIMLGMRGYELYMQTSAWDIVFQQWTAQSAMGMDNTMLEKMEEQLSSTPWGKQGWMAWLNQLKGYIQGDFGKSLWYDRTVLSLIQERLPISMLIGTIASATGLLLGIPYGIWQTKHGKIQAWIHRFLLSMMMALPPLALLLMLTAGAEKYGILPYLWHGVLPMGVLILMNIGFISVYTKNSVEHEKAKPYGQALKAKGIGDRAIAWRHQIPNALLPIVARLPSAWVMALLGSVGIIEMVWGMEGIGHLWITALNEQDTPIIHGVLFMGSALVFVAKMGDDLLLYCLDPRVRLWE